MDDAVSLPAREALKAAWHRPGHVAERVVAAAERCGRYLGVGLELHVSRQWALVRERVVEGAIGRL
jgi:hypothetical protein